ncbi:MAG: DNA polymerase III subunit beta [Verrucomicrobia bacterium]|nr:DNA polymerase III subunit beta [Verrucomicrobiota bacterium]MBS0647258.1 DNA polymerase III subunit beta [Verrucomicrobiota bacterium]
MKFVVSRQELAQLIRNIQNIVPQNAPIPVLSHVLIEAADNELVFTATDLTVGSRCHAPAKVLEPGGLSVPSKRFFQLVRELTDQTLTVNAVDGEMAEILSGTSSFRLHGIDKNEYPQLPNLEEATRFSLPGAVLKDMLYRTAFAVSKEESRFVLTGVLMRIFDSKAIFVGTDAKRLARTQIAIPVPSDLVGEYILPIKAVDEIIKILNEEEPATIYLANDKIAVESGRTLIVTKLLAGEYPDFEQIIPVGNDNEKRMELHREELITLLRQISLFTNDTTQSVRFTFQPGELVLTANCADVGEGKVSMPVNYAGDRLEMALNPFYFLDILKHSKDETVVLSVFDPYNPGIIRDSTQSLFIIMPMRLNHDQ